MSIGFSEIIIIIIVAACFLGPERASGAAKTLGHAFKSMRDAYKGVEDEIRPVTDEINEVKKDLKDTATEIISPGETKES